MLCLVVAACSKRDPILPGVRHDIFDTNDVNVVNQDVPDLPGEIKKIYGDESCEYKQDAQNNIFSGQDKIFTGFATDSFVKSNQSPICVGRFVYAGLSVGQVVKINSSTKKIVWMADVFKEHSLTGGTSVVDIIAHVGVDGKYVYAGGLGDAFCKLSAESGKKFWCLDISVPVDFIIVDNFAFVVGGDNSVYAVNVDNGAVYWKTEIKKQKTPKYDGKYLMVGKQKLDYKTGKIID